MAQLGNKTVKAARATGQAGPRGAGSSLPQLDPKQILLSIRDRWISATAIALVVCALLGGWLLRQPKIYQSEARLLIERGQRILNMTQVVDNSVGAGRNDPMFDTHLEQIVSRAVIDRVVDSLTPVEKKRVWRPYDYESIDVLPENIDMILRTVVTSAVSAARSGGTFLIGIRVKHRDPEVAAFLATRFAEQYLLYLLDRNSALNSSAITFLREQADDLRKKAEASERALQVYRENSGLVSLEESQNIVVERMKSLSGTVTAARVALLSIEARLRQAEAILANSGDPLELASTAEFSNLAAVQTQIDDLQAKRVIMAEKYGRRHPAMVENERSKEALVGLRTELIKTAMANLRNQRAKAISEEEQLQKQLADAEKESLRLDRVGIEYNVLRRGAETNRVIYSQILTKLNETMVTSQLEGSNIKISDRGQVRRVPVEPDTRKITFMLLVLGLGIIIVYPVGMELLFNRVKTWSDVENYLGVPLLAELPALDKIESSTRPHLLTKGTDEDAAEAIRALYAQLKLNSRIDSPKTLLVTSTVPGEGKSFVAANLAAAFAVHGQKTLLIDADLRRPVQHRAFGIPNTAGVLRWLDHKEPSLENLISNPDLGIHRASEGFYLLPAGGTTRRTTELIEDVKVQSLLGALQKQFDVIIIDTPPAGVFPDALSFSKIAHELVFVIRFNHVARPNVRRVIDRFGSTNIEIPGVVLNMMPSGRGSASYYSGYGYYGSKYYSAYDAKTEKADTAAKA